MFLYYLSLSPPLPHSLSLSLSLSLSPSLPPSLPPSLFQTELNQSVNMLQSKNAELESVLDYLRAQPEEIDVDEAVQATNPLYNQLVKLSIEMSVFFLSKIL